MLKPHSAAAVFIFAAILPRAFAGEPRTGGGDKSSLVVLVAPLNLKQPQFAGSVESIGPDGSLRIGPFESKSSKPAPANQPLTEGFWLGVVRGTLKSMDDAHLVRIEVTKIDKNGIDARVGRGLQKKIMLGKLILLFRPAQSTTDQMKALPDLVTIEKGTGPIPGPIEDPEQAPRQRGERSARNLQEIAQAMLAFEGTFKQFPPAKIVGPDGKPWHSWRVLLLPFLDSAELYNRYKFDEPWDGANNQKLLASMPRVYTDQPSVKASEPFTRYAAVTGSGTAFSADGYRFDGKRRGIGAGIKMRQVLDGTSNTLAIGTLPSETKIPWMMPEDVVVGDKLMRIGEKTGFGAPYESAGKNYALFARLDGGVTGVFDSIDQHDFHTLLTIADGKPSNLGVTGVFAPEVPDEPKQHSDKQGPVIYIFKEGGETKVRLVR